MAQYKVPVVIEIILERVTNISIGTEIDPRRGTGLSFRRPLVRRRCSSGGLLGRA
jgi:hypothetical protein